MTNDTAVSPILGTLLALMLCIALVSVSGCSGISSCVPVKVDAKYPSISDGSMGTVIIEGKSIPIYDTKNAYGSIIPNQTNYVQFESNFVVGHVINGVCSP